MTKAFLSLVLAIIVLFTPAGYGALQLSLSVSVQNGSADAALVFSGSVTNTSTTSRVFLNGVQITFSGSHSSFASQNSNTFYSNVPGILLPNETYTGPLFQVLLAANSPSDDYGGTVNFVGGSTITASDSLTSATFAVLSPSVQITATQPNASEYGPASGLFTISRTGRTDTDLNVSYAIQGTALNGFAYGAIPTGQTIPAGSSASAVTITPIPNDVTDGDRTVILSLAASPSYNLAALSSDTVTIHDKPVDAWRLATYGPLANSPAAADGADPSGDGIVNLLKYALNIGPANPAFGALPGISSTGGYLNFSFVANPTATDIAFAVQASPDLVSWSSDNVVDITPSNPTPPGLRTYRYNAPLGTLSRLFLRLNITRLNNSP